MDRLVVAILSIILATVSARQNATVHAASLSISIPGLPAFLDKQERRQDIKTEQQQAKQQQPQERPTDSKGLGDQLEGGDENGDRGLPAGWEKAWSEEEDRYYYANRKTGESSWTKPAMTSVPQIDQGEKPTAQLGSQDEETANEDVGPESKFIREDGNTYIIHAHYKDKVKEMHSHEHHIFAKGIIAAVVVFSIIIVLAQNPNGTIGKNTWATMDMVVVTFVALIWFYVTMHFLDLHKLSGWTKVFMHLGISVFLLLVSTFASFVIKNKGGSKAADTFNSIFDSILLWSFAGFVSNVQQQYKHSAVFVLLATFGLLIFYAVLAAFWYFVFGSCTDKDSSRHSINTITGAALAAGIVFWMHMVIAGDYQTVEDPRPNKPSFVETVFMNCFSLLYIVVALKAGPEVQKWSQQLQNSYWKKRAVDSFGVFVCFLPYYSCVLSFGHLIIDNCGYEVGAIEARLYLAALSTLIGMGLIVLCAKVKRLARDDTLTSILIGLGGFMAGSAWANLLNNSITMMASGSQHPFKIKLAWTCFLTSVVFPVYLYYFKPIVDEKMKASSLQ